MSIFLMFGLPFDTLGKADGLARDWTVDLLWVRTAGLSRSSRRRRQALVDPFPAKVGLRGLGDAFQPLSDFANRAGAPRLQRYK